MAATDFRGERADAGPPKSDAATAVGSAGRTSTDALWPRVVDVYQFMSPARRRQFKALMGVTLIGAFAELATIGAIVPFLSLVARQRADPKFPIAARLFNWMGANTLSEQIVAATIVFSALVVIGGVIRLQLSYSTQSFGHRLAHEVMVEIQRRLLLQPYSFHLQRNTSTLLSALEKAELIVFEVLLALMVTAINLFIVLFIVAALVYVDPVTALIAAVTFCIIYLLASALARPRLVENSAIVGRGFDERLRIAQESLAGIRDVIIDNSQRMHVKLFERENAALNLARANTAFIAAAPRFVIETVGMIAIAAVALFASTREGGFAAAIPVLGAIALGAQKLIPLLQQAYSGWSRASGHLSLVGQLGELLRLPVDEDQARANRLVPLPFNDRIVFDKVGFAYLGRRDRTLVDATVEIARGSTVALMGSTGSGKSTFADLLMGLIEPSSGQIRIDGQPLTGENQRRWQCNIAHVPQNIFLADATIARNIALARGDEPTDFAGIVNASRKAQLHQFVESLPEGYDTVVGERGIRLSGGQRQRLGIARAIYKDTPVLVLDEATSALDPDTESAVVQELKKLASEGRTLIIIAHRLSAVVDCDYILKVEGGSVERRQPGAEREGSAGKRRR